MSAALQLTESLSRQKQLAIREALFGDRTDWLEERYGYLGGTDVAAIVNRHKYKTAYDVWDEKVNRKSDSAGRHAELGLLLEHLIDRWVLEETKQEAYAVPTIYHPKYPFLAVNPDRILSSGALSEYKSYGYSTEDEWGPTPEGPIPIHYEVQCQMQLGICLEQGLINQEVNYVFGVHRDKLELSQWEVWFDRELYDLLVNAAVEFHETYVATKSPPELTRRDVGRITELFPDPNGEAISTTQDDDMIGRALELSASIKPMEKELKEIKDDLKIRYGDKQSLLSVHGKVSMRRSSRSTVDGKGLVGAGVSSDLVLAHTKTSKSVAVYLPNQKD